LSIISTAIKLIKYNLTDESKFEITGKDFMEPPAQQSNVTLL